MSSASSPRVRALGLLVVVGVTAAALCVARDRREPSRPPIVRPRTIAATTPRRRAPAAPTALRLSGAERVPSDRAGLGTFSGVVLSVTTGAGVAGATLTFVREGASLQITAGRDGRFELAPAAPGAHELVMVSAEGYSPYAPEVGHSPVVLVAAEGQDVRGLTLYLTPRVPYAVAVRGASNAPLPGAEVRVLDGEGRSVRADARGEATVFAPDDAVVEARHPGYAPARAVVDLAVQVSHRMCLRLTPGASDAGVAGALSGAVLGPDGQPIDGALVVARWHGADLGAQLDRTHPAARALTDPAGRFALDALDAGEYALSASARGLATAHAQARTDAHGIVLRLARGATLRGRVRDATGAAVTAFTVVLSRRRGAMETGEGVATSVFDPSGRYEVAGLSPGAWTVTGVALGYAPSPGALVTVAPPPEDVTQDLTLSRGGSLTGRVVERITRVGIEGAQVALEGSLRAADAPMPLLSVARAGRDGSFTLTGLAPGLRSVTVTAAGHHGRVLSGLRVEPDGSIGPLTVDLAATEAGEVPRLELVGIGAVLVARGDALVVGETIPGGGAAEAGIAPGDEVLSVDDTPVTALGFEGAIQRIRGPEGSVVRLTLRRDGSSPALAVQRRRVLR